MTSLGRSIHLNYSISSHEIESFNGIWQSIHLFGRAPLFTLSDIRRSLIFWPVLHYCCHSQKGYYAAATGVTHQINVGKVRTLNVDFPTAISRSWVFGEWMAKRWKRFWAVGDAALVIIRVDHKNAISGLGTTSRGCSPLQPNRAINCH
jgi:hypothetical protein